MADTPTLVKFFYGWAEDGLDDEGFPRFRDTIMITLSRPPYLKIDREATEDDFDEYDGAYALFKKEAKSHTPEEIEGYPLAFWPVIKPSELQTCAIHDVHTVQQLADLAKRGADKVPTAILELAKRAAKMIDMQKKVGKFEAQIRQLTDERDTVVEQLNEARQTISAQNSIISTLKMKVA